MQVLFTKILKVWPVALLVCLKSELQHQLDLKINLVAHWKYLSIIKTINKGLLNKKLLLSIIMVLRQNFLNTFIEIAILGKIYHCSSCYAKLEQHWIECICVHSSPIIHLFDCKKLALSITVGFHKNSLIVACCTFGRFKFRTLTPSRFKNQTNDTFKLLCHNYNHQQGFGKKNCCSPSLWF